MNHLLVKCFVYIIMIFVVDSAYAMDCDKLGSSEDAAYCIGKELRESDARINQTYQALMSKLAKSEQDKLRHEQRSWIKERDAVCNCASRESDREKWYQGLLKDYRKTVCVTRYTRQRTAELDRMLTDISYEPQNKKTAAAPWQPRTNTVKYVETDYQIWSKGDKTKGRWYFEVTVNTGSIAGFSPTALWVGCVDRKSGEAFGSLSQIRGSSTDAGVSRMGYALDLESGKLYIRRNGAWSRGTPGSLGGLDLKLGRPYRCGVETTVLIAPLADKGYLQLNFGEKPFAYSIPDGYLPFVEGGSASLFPKSYSGDVYTFRTLGAKFVLIPAGTFIMGSPIDDPERIGNETPHQVTISEPFLLQTTEVTQGDWKLVMGSNPSHFINCGDDCPVEQVSWNDVQDFISRLNQLEGTDRYRLPTEAEWEYAARAGSLSTRYGDIDNIAWCHGNSDLKTHAVGQKLPNAWGLYDMLGNVWEWCQDLYGDYPYGSVTDPVGKQSGYLFRIYRGGSYSGKGWGCRATSRTAMAPQLSGDSIGFRLARSAR